MTSLFPLPDDADPPTNVEVCVPVPDDVGHRAAFLGALYNLTRWYSWARDGSSTGKAAADRWMPIWDQVSAALGSVGCGEGMATILRQNPEDTCQLQYSVDDGETWELAFDYGLCVTPTDQILLNGAIASLTAAATLPGAPGATFIYSTDDSAADVSDRMAALCYAVKALIDGVLDLYISAVNGDLTALTAYVSITALGLALGALIALSVAMALAAAIIAIVLYLYISFTSLLSTTVAADQDVRDHLYCILYSRLLLRGANYTNFSKAFESAACFDADTDSAVAFMDAVVKSPGGGVLFTAFMNVLSNAYFSVQLGADPGTCEVCPDSTWCYEMTGQEFRDNFECYVGYWNAATGAFESARNAADHPGLGTTYGVYIRSKTKIFIPPGTQLTNMGHIYYRVSSQSIFIQDQPDASGAYRSATTAVTNGYWWLLPGATNAGLYPRENVLLHVHCGVTANGYTFQGRVYGIRFQGTGVNPWGACDQCP